MPGERMQGALKSMREMFNSIRKFAWIKAQNRVMIPKKETKRI
jgi:hypothetical protein